jgi:cysteinyl-tRNA synthetase
MPGPLGHGGDEVVFAASDRAPALDVPLSDAGRALHQRLVDAIDDDLDLPTALVVVRETLRADLPDDERRWLALDADQVLGLDLDRIWDEPAGVDAVPADVQALADERALARASRDFARADALRAEIEAAGWEVEDAPDGSTVRRRAWWPRPSSD